MSAKESTLAAMLRDLMYLGSLSNICNGTHQRFGDPGVNKQVLEQCNVLHKEAKHNTL